MNGQCWIQGTKEQVMHTLLAPTNVARALYSSLLQALGGALAFVVLIFLRGHGFKTVGSRTNSVNE